MKKFLCVILAVTMGMSLFTACKSTQTSSTNSNITLTWYVPGDKQADIATVLEAANKIIKSKIGVTLDMQFIDSGAFQQRMNMNMASSSDYDLAFVGYLNKYTDAAQNGGLLKLDDMLKETPELVNSIPEYQWDLAKVNGSLYAVPNIQIIAGCTALQIRKDLAQKYNLDVSKITKTTDIEPFLKQVKENEPGIYPFRASWGVASFRSLDEKIMNNGQQLYNVIMDEATGKYKVVDGQEYGQTKEKAKILNDWFNKGYIRKDVASVMDDTQEVKSGKYAVMCSGYKPGMEAEFANNYGYEILTAKVSPATITQGANTATMIGIGKNSKHPKEALKLIELLNTDKELYNMICFGVEGKHYKKIGENRIELIPNSGYAPNASWKFGNQFNAYLLPGQADDTWEKTKELNDSAIKVGLLGFTENIDSIKTIITKVTSIQEEYDVVDNGTQDPETYFKEYKDKLYAAGLQTIIDELQKQVDEFLSK